ncbi:sulfatase-like hydrolase/transferase [Halobellus sp. GM3]|uniref:sulfatase-like hydrolase/transferase n=1 Tax=Halobellus sp. GM3 TaxID=3458410 RepID=UPI00403DC9A8
MSDRGHPNIIFIVIDTCRAKTFYDLLDAGKLPWFKHIFDQSIDFRRATAPAPWTVPSHASLFTGLYPDDHRSSANSPNFNPPNTPLAKRLKEYGYETAGISANPWVSPNYNFDIGFDRFKTAYDFFWNGTGKDDLRKLSSRKKQFHTLLKQTSWKSIPKTVIDIIYEKTMAKRSDSGAQRITEDAINFLSSNNSPKFLFLNYMEPHLEYDPPEKLAVEELPPDVDLQKAYSTNQNPWEYLAGNIEMDPADFEILRGLYRAEIRYLDSQIGKLFNRIEQDDINETCFVVVGDHGENIGEHRLMDHQYSIYQTLIHVPLAIRYPKRIEPGRIEKPVETRHICETLCQLVGEQSQNRTNKSLIAPSELDDEIIAEYPDPQPSLDDLRNRVGSLGESIMDFDRALRAIRYDKWKLIEGSDGHTELYNLDVDPEESTPISNEKIQHRLRKKLHSKRGELKMTDSEGKGQEVNDRLKDLGYL